MIELFFAHNSSIKRQVFNFFIELIFFIKKKYIKIRMESEQEYRKMQINTKISHLIENISRSGQNLSRPTILVHKLGL